MGTFYGIGVGPGDSELITVKAVNIIKKLTILYAPQARKNGLSFAEKIATPYFTDSLTIKRRHFPMTHDLAEKQQSWNEIAAEIIKDVKAGNEVGFITLGDPSVYSTYSYLADIVRDDVPIKTIAGISSYSQIAAEVSIPLTIDNESLEVIPATASIDQISQALDVNDNVVLMKVSAKFEAIYQLLSDRELLGNALLVSDASLESERARKLSEMAISEKVPYFSTVLIKKQLRF
jgi:precorrin-2/cobalt-factor-2 C20-methyltransferase